MKTQDSVSHVRDADVRHPVRYLWPCLHDAVSNGRARLGQRLKLLSRSSRYQSLSKQSGAGFVEFDDLNGILLSYSRDQSLYKLWRLSDYSVCWQRQI